MILRTFLCAAAVAWMVTPSAILVGQEPSRDGLVMERPKSGPFVRTDLGYMVPYRQRIPGTDIQFQMVPIAGGQFLLGSPGSEVGRQDAEGPQVSVMIKPFWMGKYEVTWKEFRVYMGLDVASREQFRRTRRSANNDDSVDAVTAPSEVYDISFAYEGGDGPDTPAVTMTHFSAKQYTKWLSLLLEDFYRLPQRRPSGFQRELE